MYTETTLATLTWDELCRAFRRVYEGYMVTLQIDTEWMQSHVERNSIVLRESPLWLDASGDVVGLALLGVRPPRGWVGGFGLSPQYRGQGLAGHILDAIMTRAEDLGLTTLQLEVLQNNHKAYRVYANFDFEPVRKVETLTCPLFYPEIPLEGAMFAPWERAKGLPYRQDLVWQREAPWAPREGGQLIVYGTEWLCFRLQRNKILLLDASARESTGLEALLTDLRHRYPRPPIVLANEAVGSPLYRQLTALHWQESLPQWEMRCILET